MGTQTTEQIYTFIEVQALLTSLSEADRARLIQSYRVMGCEQRAGMDAHDVLSEVACKVLSMKRAWPQEVHPLAYLIETGRSIISNEEKKYVREVTTDPDEIDTDRIDLRAGELLMEAFTPSPEIQSAQCLTDM